MKRQIPLVNNELYHILNRSIAEFKIFNQKSDFLRVKDLFRYYQYNTTQSFSHFMTLAGVKRSGFDQNFAHIRKNSQPMVQIIGFCIMPTHIHIILKQLENNGISKYMSNILNSYSKYFNAKHRRKGPLWEAKFKNILIKNDEQLLHLTRYIHLNPSTARLVNKPEKWQYSSYREYLNPHNKNKITDYKSELNIIPDSYEQFVNERIQYQRKLAKIKSLMLE